MTTTIIKNSEITSETVRLSDGGTSEIVSTVDALELAESRGLDLIVVSDKSDPPVCKIVDYGKFQYENEKRLKEIKRNSRKNVVETKEIQLRPVTDKRDIQIKAKKASTILDNGDKVRVVVKFKGRENSHKELGKNIFDIFLESVGEHVVDSPINDLGRDMTITIKRS